MDPGEQIVHGFPPNVKIGWRYRKVVPKILFFLVPYKVCGSATGRTFHLFEDYVICNSLQRWEMHLMPGLTWEILDPFLLSWYKPNTLHIFIFSPWLILVWTFLTCYKSTTAWPFPWPHIQANYKMFFVCGKLPWCVYIRSISLFLACVHRILLFCVCLFGHEWSKL